ncbi:26S proteasome regulatory subunit N5 [Nematocida major]|uniref:26S proteasome regulatory subunit N5 n=1 Tax=Nematocida major TaxID=1912982 RepID=UPI002008CA0F|nr:26S proteasome regulatory subunit N5 [Nematocida major]KAH9386568.1 26S proteasome regulatory subunit N5 [Nematocida major]
MDLLQEREKTARLNGDKDASAAILVEIVDATKTPQETVEAIRQMARKKGQLKEALSTMIHHAYRKYISLSPVEIEENSYETVRLIDIGHAYAQAEEKAPPSEDKDEFLDFLVLLLTTVVEGRIYMEELRIFITDAIKQIYVKRGDMKKALSYVYPVHVETFSSVSMKRILQYQLEQLRIAILAREYGQAILVSQRMSMKQLETEPELADYHLNRMLFIHIHRSEYYKIACIFNTLRIKDEAASKTESIYSALAILFCILDIHSAESKQILVANISSKICQNDTRVLGDAFTNNLLITEAIYSTLHTIQEKYGIQGIVQQYIPNIRERVSQYNIIVISKYYSRIEIARIVEILKMQPDEFVEIIVEMIRSKLVEGTISQIEGIIEFKKETNTVESWNRNINACLDAVIKITHSLNSA